jgi:2-aminoadipate transaminase
MPPRPTTDPGSLLARWVAALSTSAPFAVPADRPGRRTVHLTSGSPAPEALPLDDLASTYDAVLRERSRAVAALQYSDSAGLPRLRAALAAAEGVPVERVVVTNGALHGVQLALQAVVEPGDLVIVDDPVFPDTRRIIESTGGTVLPVVVDREGIDVDAIEALLRGGARPKAVYTVPDFHNPSGHTLSAARRGRLVELAERYGFLIVSDNPYRVHRLHGDDVPDLDDAGDHVVRVSTFSKTLGPGLRLGWVIAPGWLAPHLVNVRRRVDFHSNTLTQHVAADLLERAGWFDDLAARTRLIYRRRAEHLVTSLRAHTGGLLDFVDPDGGFFVWARVADPSVGAGALTAGAAEAGLLFAPGSAFAPTAASAAHDFVRLAYSTADLADLDAAGAVLAEVAERVRTGRSLAGAR